MQGKKGKIYSLSSKGTKALKPLNTSQYKAVKKIVNGLAEKKLIIGNTISSRTVANTTEKDHLTPITQGVEDSMRNGNRVSISRFHFGCKLLVSEREVIRLMIVQAKDGTFTDTDVIPDGASGPYFWSDYRNSNVKILYDRNFVGKEIGNDTVYNVNITDKMLGKQFQRKLYFEADADTSASNGLYLITCGTHATDSGSLNQQVSNYTFTDF